MSDTVDPKITTAKSAAGQYLGYSLQQVRLCVYLLHRPSAHSVFMESLDDIAVKDEEGFYIVEQAKSALTHNPSTPWSQNLWDAIAHWIDLAEKGRLCPAKTTFRYYVAPDKRSSFVSRMHAATDNQTAETVISDVADRREKLKNAPACDGDVQRFLNADRPTLRQIICNFEMVTGNDPLEPVREYMRAAVTPENLDNFCRSAIGIASTMIDEKIRNGLAPCVSTDAFRRKLRSHISRYDTSKLVGSVIETPTDAELDKILQEKQTFVHQMEVINLNDRERMRAVSDYLKARAATTLWASEGRVLEESIKELRDDLVREHAYIQGDIYHENPQVSYERIGVRTFFKCCRLQKNIDSYTAPAFYVPGTYQELADYLMIEWHPKYKETYVSHKTHD